MSLTEELQKEYVKQHKEEAVPKLILKIERLKDLKSPKEYIKKLEIKLEELKKIE